MQHFRLVALKVFEKKVLKKHFVKMRLKTMIIKGITVSTVGDLHFFGIIQAIGKIIYSKYKSIHVKNFFLSIYVKSKNSIIFRSFKAVS